MILSNFNWLSCTLTGAIWQGDKGSGKVSVCGSVGMFEDSWIDKENNAKLFDFLMLWLLGRIPIKVSLGFSNYVIL